MDLSHLAPVMLDHVLKPATSVARERAQVPPPTALYHFTTADGLLGILRSKSMWASLSESLNDAHELIYAEQLALKVADAGVTDAPEEMVKDLGRLLRNQPVASSLPIPILQVFVTSFCESINSSSQWLNYGGRGTGIALELNATSLSSSQFDLIPVTYSESEQVELIQRVVRRVADGMSNFLTAVHLNPGPGFYSIGAYMALQGIRLLAPGMKAPSFSSEQEWRLVTFRFRDDPDMTTLPVHFRVGSGRIMAYVERQFSPGNLPLTSVVLGYSCPNDPSDETFKLVLPNLPVERSTVPVRP